MNETASIYRKSIKEKILNNILTDKKTHLVGYYKNFNITIKLLINEPQITVIINARRDDDEKNTDLYKWLRLNINNLKDVINVGANANNVVLIIKRPVLGTKVPELVNYNVDYVINYLNSKGYNTSCSSCNSTTGLECYQVNNNYNYYCNSCIGKVDQNLQKNKIKKQNAKPNMIKGIIGAIIGAIIGMLIWIIIYKIGFIASIGGFAIAYGTLLGFEKMGKNLNKKSVIICIVIMILTVWLSNRVAWTLDAYTTLKNELTFMDCFINLGELLEYNGYTGNYIGELIVGYILTLVGSLKTIIKTLKNISGNYTIKKV